MAEPTLALARFSLVVCPDLRPVVQLLAGDGQVLDEQPFALAAGVHLELRVRSLDRIAEAARCSK